MSRSLKNLYNDVGLLEGDAADELLAPLNTLELLFGAFLKSHGSVVSQLNKPRPDMTPFASAVYLEEDACPPGTSPCATEECFEEQGLNMFNADGDECYDNQVVNRARAKHVKQLAARAKASKSTSTVRDTRRLLVAARDLTAVVSAAATLSSRLQGIGHANVACGGVNALSGTTESKRAFCGTLVDANGALRCKFDDASGCVDASGAAVAAAPAVAVAAQAPAAPAAAARALAAAAPSPAVQGRMAAAAARAKAAAAAAAETATSTVNGAAQALASVFSASPEAAAEAVAVAENTKADLQAHLDEMGSQLRDVYSKSLAAFGEGTQEIIDLLGKSVEDIQTEAAKVNSDLEQKRTDAAAEVDKIIQFFNDVATKAGTAASTFSGGVTEAQRNYSQLRDFLSATKSLAENYSKQLTAVKQKQNWSMNEAFDAKLGVEQALANLKKYAVKLSEFTDVEGVNDAQKSSAALVQKAINSAGKSVNLQKLSIYAKAEHVRAIIPLILAQKQMLQGDQVSARDKLMIVWKMLAARNFEMHAELVAKIDVLIALYADAFAEVVDVVERSGFQKAIFIVAPIIIKNLQFKKKKLERAYAAGLPKEVLQNLQQAAEAAAEALEGGDGGAEALVSAIPQMILFPGFEVSAYSDLGQNATTYLGGQVLTSLRTGAANTVVETVSAAGNATLEAAANVTGQAANVTGQVTANAWQDAKVGELVSSFFRSLVPDWSGWLQKFNVTGTATLPPSAVNQTVDALQQGVANGTIPPEQVVNATATYWGAMKEWWASGVATRVAEQAAQKEAGSGAATREAVNAVVNFYSNLTTSLKGAYDKLPTLETVKATAQAGMGSLTTEQKIALGVVVAVCSLGVGYRMQMKARRTREAQQYPFVFKSKGLKRVIDMDASMQNIIEVEQMKLAKTTAALAQISVIPNLTDFEQLTLQLQYKHGQQVYRFMEDYPKNLTGKLKTLKPAELAMAAINPTATFKGYEVPCSEFNTVFGYDKDTQRKLCNERIGDNGVPICQYSEAEDAHKSKDIDVNKCYPTAEYNVKTTFAPDTDQGTLPGSKSSYYYVETYLEQMAESGKTAFSFRNRQLTPEEQVKIAALYERLQRYKAAGILFRLAEDEYVFLNALLASNSITDPSRTFPEKYPAEAWENRALA